MLDVRLRYVRRPHKQINSFEQYKGALATLAVWVWLLRVAEKPIAVRLSVPDHVA